MKIKHKDIIYDAYRIKKKQRIDTKDGLQIALKGDVVAKTEFGDLLIPENMYDKYYEQIWGGLDIYDPL